MGCPVRAPIKEAVALLLDSKVLDAGKLLFENNPLSLVCSHVCTQENQCEGHCIVGKKGKPVCISEIEQYISDYYLSIYRPTPSLKTSGKAAIVGSGPAGITIAFLLAEKNYDVTIFEGHDQIGGIMRYGIPEFRLPKSIVDRLATKLVEKGVKVRPNTIIGVNLSIEDLFRDGYGAVFLGTGTWRPRKLEIKGESLGHVHFAVEYLKNPSVIHIGRSVLVIGGGNVAMDVARTAFRQGSREVTIVCRRDVAVAREHDIQYAKIDGALLEFNKTPVEIVDGGVIFADTGAGGKPVSGTEKLYHADSVIIAVGQGPRSIIATSTKGLNLGESGLVAVDEFGHTSRDGVFAGGDVVTGARTVIAAVAASKRIAQAMDEYMRGEAGEPHR
jgi:glutamate synthase (NADPH/NADH) small chain